MEGAHAVLRQGAAGLRHAAQTQALPTGRAARRLLGCEFLKLFVFKLVRSVLFVCQKCFVCLYYKTLLSVVNTSVVYRLKA